MASYDETGPAAARVGADLRAARERLGWSLPALAAHLRIRLPYLAALEDGRIGDLPGVAYAVGFLRTYATILGLDPDEMSRRFRTEVAEANHKTELNFPAPVPDRGIPAGALILVGALLAIGAYAGWYRLSERAAPVAELIQPVPELLASLADKSNPPPVPAPPPAAAPVTPAPVAATEPPPPAVSPSSAAAASAVPVPQAAQPEVADLAPPEPSPVPAAVPVTLPSPAAAAPAAPPPPHLVVQATADAWIQVRAKSGHVLLNRVLRSGETWTVPDEPSLLLTTGNAGGTELVVDGVATPPLGRNGAVRRDLPLDVTAIKDGQLAPPSRHS